MLGDPDDVEEFRPARRTGGLWLGFLGSIAFVAAGVFIVGHARDTFEGLAGLACMGFFSLTAVASVYRIVRNRPVVFTPEGLEFPSVAGRRFVAWSNVKETGIWRHKGQAVNVLWLKDVAALDQGGYGLLRGANRMLGAGDVSLGWADRDRRAEEFDELLRAWVRRYGGGG